MFRIAFLAPQIGPNAGNVIRTAAATGCEFHLIKPLGFNMSDRQLRRAGLDYHDLATVVVHEDFEAAYAAWGAPRIFAFSAHGDRAHTDIAYAPGDVLLFGSEHDGLPAPILADPRMTEVVRIPMLPARRSLNLANATAIAVYEAWRQQEFAGAVVAGSVAAGTEDGDFV